MHYAIVFNYYEFRTQLSDMLDVPQFHKISITKSKCSHREVTGNILGFPVTDGQYTLNR